MKINSLNEADPLSKLGAKVEPPKQATEAEKKAQAMRNFERATDFGGAMWFWSQPAPADPFAYGGRRIAKTFRNIGKPLEIRLSGDSVPIHGGPSDPGGSLGKYPKHFTDVDIDPTESAPAKRVADAAGKLEFDQFTTWNNRGGMTIKYRSGESFHIWVGDYVLLVFGAGSEKRIVSRASNGEVELSPVAPHIFGSYRTIWTSAAELVANDFVSLPVSSMTIGGMTRGDPDFPFRPLEELKFPQLTESTQAAIEESKAQYKLERSSLTESVYEVNVADSWTSYFYS